MGDIDILVCDYCEEKISRLSKLLPNLKIYTESIYKHVRMTSYNVSKHVHCKPCCYTYVSANYHGIT